MADTPTTLAENIGASFVDLPIAGGAYVVELIAPEELATAPPGRPALQHVRLRAHREGRPAIVAGSVSPLERHAELRTFEHAVLVHRIRFGRPFDISLGEWERLLRRLEAVLAEAGIESARVGPSPDVLHESRLQQRRSRVSPRAIVVFVVVTVLALAMLVRVYQKLRG